MCPNNDAHSAKRTSACDLSPDIPAPNNRASDMRQTCVIAPVIFGAGAPSQLAFQPPVRGRAERRVPDAPFGPDAKRSSARDMRQDFRSERDQPGVPHAVVLTACFVTTPGDRSCSFITTPGGRCAAAARARATLVLPHGTRTMCRDYTTWARPPERCVRLPFGSRDLSAGAHTGAVPVAGLAQTRPAHRRPSPPHRATPHLRRPPHPAPRSLTIAIAPLSGAGRRGSYSSRGNRQEQNRNRLSQTGPPVRRTRPTRRFRLLPTGAYSLCAIRL
jgi:hypothetical protein